MNSQTLQLLAFVNFFFLAIAILVLYYFYSRLKRVLRREVLLKKESNEYRELFNATWDGVVRLDPHGRIVFINQAGARMLGYESAEALIHSDYDLTNFYVDPEDQKKMKKELEDSKNLKNFRVSGKRKNGEKFHAEVTAHVHRNEKGEIVKFEGIFRDVTERILFEEGLKQYNVKLEKEVRKRTRELEKTNRKLEKEILGHRVTEDKVKAALREKELLLKEIHHRVKNNLQVISSLLGLQSIQVDHPRYQDMFRDCQERIRSMAMVHEQLYESKDITKIDFAKYIRRLTHNLMHNYKIVGIRIDLQLRLTPVSLDIDEAIPCGLIVNELMTNSLKHAFPDGYKGKGKIRISLSKKNRNICLAVGDNGVGFKQPIDPHKTESLGLKLITILAEEQLQGKLDLNTRGGTRFEVIFPQKS